MNAVPTSPLRLLLVGLGPLGRIIASDLYERRLGHIVAAVDSSPLLAGKRLDELIKTPDPGGVEVLVSSSAAEIRNWSQIDAAVVATASDLRLAAPVIIDLARRGLPVVSTCEELVWPWLRHPALAREIDEAAKRGGGRVLGTGVNPGFLMDTLPVALTAVSKSVRAVSVHRIQDASTRRIPFQQKIGAGLDDVAFRKKIDEGTLRHVGLGESMHFVAHYLGLTIDRWEESIEPVRAERPLPSAIGPIAAGLAAGVRQVARGYTRDGQSERLVVNMEFQAAIGQTNPHDRVVIDGDPNIDLVIRGGVHGDVATSAITLNAIRSLTEAAPGLHTMATVPCVRFTGLKLRVKPPSLN
ncbi:MAG: dihydrodipicolinate reductase [Phycisphaerales bacterium]|nr:dihydrodipicolinate reductase [Phycisphaerales bacterium]